MDSNSVDPTSDWIVQGEPDAQTVDANWNPVGGAHIHGVVVKEVRPVPIGSGCLTEVWRRDWTLDPLTITQVFQRVIEPLLVVVPPGVWHGLSAMRTASVLVLSLVDHDFHYERPDQRRLPPDTSQIPLTLV